MQKYIIVAETGADIPQDLVERYQIAVVPMHVSFGNAEYADGAIPVDQIFEHYKTTRELPKTSGSIPQDFTKVFDELHRDHPEATLIHLAYSAVTTCSYESARTAAEGRDYVVRFDTKSVSAGQAMVVVDIARLIEEQPTISLKDLSTAISNRIRRICMGFVPGDLEYLRAGGRVSNVAYMGAQLLRMKPVIEILDGRLMATKKYRGSIDQAANKLMDEYPAKNRLSKDQLFLIYSKGLDSELMKTMEAKAHAEGYREVRWVQAGCVVSSHAGPGAFGVVGFTEE